MARKKKPKPKPPEKPKFKPGSKVKIAGKPGTWTIAHILMLPVPQIIDFDFRMTERIVYKFIPNSADRSDNFYAYETDVSEAKK